MVRACHVIFGAYGFWLPNDPRGSWSDFVGAWELFRFGPATKVTTRRSLARAEHDVTRRLAAKQALKYPPVQFTGPQARAVARGFAAAADKIRLTVRACSILPDHVHLVLARHERIVEQVVRYLKAEATKQLKGESNHPLGEFAVAGRRFPQTFAEGQWKVFLDDDAGIRRAIGYVRDNPIREGLPRQRWRFVTEFA